jgi:hypothetical protein
VKNRTLAYSLCRIESPIPKRYRQSSPFFWKLDHPQGCRFAEGGTMENYRIEELRAELTHLLKKQTQVLESRAFGAANDGDILEYEIRQEVIHEICNQLANSTAA